LAGLPRWPLPARAAVLLYALDRLTRDLPDAIHLGRLFQERNVPLVTAKEGQLTDLFMTNIRAVVAEEERRRIRERTHDGSRRVAADGRWVFGKAPYGYTVLRDTKGAGKLVPDERPLGEGLPSAAEVVRECFRRAAAHESCVAIAASLEARGIPTRAAASGRPKAGDQWHPTAPLRLLRATCYKGVFELGRRSLEEFARRKQHGKKPKVVEIAVPALVDEALWLAANRAVSANTWGHGARTQALLRGLLRCAHCGRLYTSQLVRRTGRHIYKCRNARCDGAVVAFNVEQQIWASVVAFVHSDREVLQAYARKLAASQQDLGKLDATLARLQKQLDNLTTAEERAFDAFSRGKASEAVWDKQRERFTVDRQLLQDEVSRVQRERSTLLAIADAIGDAEAQLARIRVEISRPDLDAATKRKVLASLVSEAAVTTEKAPIQFTDARGRAYARDKEARVDVSFAFGGMAVYYGDTVRTTAVDPKLAALLKQHAGEGLEEAPTDFDPDEGAVTKALDAVPTPHPARRTGPPTARLDRSRPGG
jgi:site-specific DNA recombinase